jgi:cysteine desulfurase
LRLPNTLNVRAPGVSGSAWLDAAPEVAASTGSACHAGEERASKVILAMGVDAGEALGSVRLTLGRRNTRDDIDRAAEALIAAWRKVVAKG